MDKSKLGVMEIDLSQGIRWANSMALEMMGLDANYAGRKLHQLFPNEAAEGTLKKELKERRSGKPGRYRLSGVRPSDGRFINVDVTGVPLHANGIEVTGSIGIFKNVDAEVLSARLHELDTELGGNPSELLKAIAGELKKYLPFDMMSVTRYSANMQHMKAFAILGERLEYATQRRWWPMSEAQRKWSTQKAARRIDDLAKFMRRREWRSMLKEKATQEMLGQGYRSAIRRVVRLQGRVIGSIGLISKVAAAYSEQDEKFLDSLPLEPILAAAIDAADRERGERKMKLLMALNGMRDIEAACATLSSHLVGLFGWSHISIFQVQHSRKMFKLVAQSSAGDVKMAVEDGYQQPLNKGILGRAASTQASQNVPNVVADRTFFRGVEGSTTRSELAVPIVFRDEAKVRFIVNAEDEKLDAFSSDEQAEMEELGRQIAVVLERIGQHEFLAQCFRHSSDPVLVVNSQRKLVTCNPEAARLIGYRRPEDLSVADVSDLFLERERFRFLLEGPSDELGELVIRRIGDPPTPPGTPISAVSVFVSRSRLPELIGGSLLVLRDLRDIHKRVEFETLAKAAYQVAIETAAPLSSALAQVDTMLKQVPESDRTELSRIRRHLLRVRDAYARLATFHVSSSPPLRLSRLNLAAELDAFLSDLPQAERDKIHYTGVQKIAAIRGDHFPLRIVLDTLMTPLIRCAPDARPVDVRLLQDAGKVKLNISGTLPPAGSDMALDRITSQSNLSLGVASGYMQEVMNGHESKIEFKVGDNGDCEYVLDFPAEVS